MIKKTTRVALLCSAAAFALSGAYAQAQEQAENDFDPEACVILAERLAEDADVDAEVRTEVEEVVAEGDVARCHLVFTTWEEEGTITRESLELVATEQVTERMIVQQEVEVEADVAVYQPPAEVDVDTGQPEIVWTMPRQSVTVDEQAPQITIRQGQPIVRVEVPQPRVSVMIPEPEVIIHWPESTLDMAELEPMIEVRIPEPTVDVRMPEPVVELSIGGERAGELVEREDGRFAPRDATDEDLEPRISIQQHEATVSPGEDAEAPEIVFNRGEPVVTIEGEEPEVTVEVVGEPEVQVQAGQRNGEREADVEIRDDDAVEENGLEDDALQEDAIDEDALQEDALEEEVELEDDLEIDVEDDEDDENEN